MKRLILILMLIGHTTGLFAQSVGINSTGTNPDSSAVLDVQSTSKGMLLPRMTSAARSAIPNPANGLLVYDSDTLNFMYFDGTAWRTITQKEFSQTNKLTYGSLSPIVDLVYNGLGTTSPIPEVLIYSASEWQSFTPTNSGFLAQIELDIMGYFNSSSVRVNLYDGEGINGTLLHTSVVSLPGTFTPPGFTTAFSASTSGPSIPIIGGQKYTIELVNLSGITWWLGDDGGYNGGRSRDDINFDFHMRISLIPGIEVLHYNPTSRNTMLGGGALTITPNGNIGIRTSSPQSRLDVGGGLTVGNTYAGTSAAPANGAIIEGNVGIGTTTPSRPLTIRGVNGGSELLTLEDNGGAAAWHLNLAGNGLNFSESGVADGRLFLRDGGNVGIGTNTPQSRLDVEGGLAVGSTYAGTNAAPTNGAIIEGNVGIGTHNPDTTLHVVGQIRYQDGNQSPGRVLTSDGNGAASWRVLEANAAFRINEQAIYLRRGTDVNHGLRFSGSFSQFANHNPDGPVLFGYSGGILGTTNGGERGVLYWNNNGNVGIGDADPNEAKVVIRGSESNTFTYGYLNGSGTTDFSQIPTTNNYSLYASNYIAAEEFNAFSDARIKDIQGRSDSQADLATLMQIEITDYRMKDSIAKGTDSYKKVIAQQVAEVYPQAVTANLTDVVPDIYQRAELQNGWIMLATDLQVGERVKLITEHSAQVYEVITAEANRFQVSGLAPDSAQVFVYGREVDDFHTVDYEAISMLNVSSTQAQQRLILALQEEIEQLKAEKKDVLSNMQAFEARLQLLETQKATSSASISHKR